MRALLRRALYWAHKYDLGCPTETKCGIYRSALEETGDEERAVQQACGPCAKHLKPAELPLTPDVTPRIQYLFRLESMVNVGCRFQPDDLTPRVWGELIDLAIERNRMTKLLTERRTDARAKDAEASSKLAEARKIDKIPAPGQSLFGPRGRAR